FVGFGSLFYVGAAMYNSHFRRVNWVGLMIICRHRFAWIMLTLSTVLCVAPIQSWAQTHQSTPTDVGYFGVRFNTAGTRNPTASKPESKLWIVENVWHGVLWDSSSASYSIHRFDSSTQNWTNMGPAIDSRGNSFSDALWDGEKLYVASHVRRRGGPARLCSYTYDSSSKSFTAVEGFPIDINDGPSETVTIARDSKGKLWATWTSKGQVMVNHSTSDESSWAKPFALPVKGSEAHSDDISAIVSFAGHVGIMWSNQLAKGVYFARHMDGDKASRWDLEIAFFDTTLGNVADDHINIKSTSIAGDHVFAVVKTSLGLGPQIVLLSRSREGKWQWFEVWGTEFDNTRPIMLVNEENRELYVFAQNRSHPRPILMKVSSMDNIEFPSGEGIEFIRSEASIGLNNPTSTHQSVNSATGILVLASDGRSRTYVHNYQSLSTVTSK
ncbi:hypothetical protein MJD09_15855, partial [bacterium]|nr:hypothetical protein [bacterium]